MSIIRTKHDKQNKFTILTNKSLWDGKLSLAAIGLWARLLSKPNDWEVSVAQLQKACSCGKHTIYKLIEELMQHGYIIRSQTRGLCNNKNVFGKFEYLIFESSEDKEEFQKSLKLTEIQEAEGCLCEEEIKCPHNECGQFPDSQLAETGYVTNTVLTNTCLTILATSPLTPLQKDKPPTPKRGEKKITPHFFITKEDLGYLDPKNQGNQSSPEFSKEETAPLPKREEKKIITQPIPKKAPPKYSRESAELVYFISETAKKKDPKCGVVNTPDSVFRDRKFAEECLKNTGEIDGKSLELCKKLVLDSWADDFWRGRICSAQNLKKHWNSLRAGLRSFKSAKPKEIVRPAGHFQEGYENPLLKIDMSKGGIF